MCGRYRRTTSEEELARRYHIPIPPQRDLPISWNIAPTQDVYAIRLHPESKQRTLDTLRWGYNASRLVSHDRASVYEWFIDLGTHRNIITDGSTRKLENLIVTTIPYHCSRQEKSIWLDRGSTIRKQTGTPWIVLHHVPAKTGLGVSGEEREASELLAAYRPDYFVSGHDHAFPYASGQSWNQKLGESRLLVPGQLLSAAIPNHIKLNTESGELSWHTASEAWIPEDGMYDHLVLKLGKG